MCSQPYVISIRFFILLAMFFGLTGCAHVVTVKETYTNTGQKGYVIDCSGDSDTHLVMHNPTWADCYEKAGQVCGDRGYKVLDRSDEQGALSGAFLSATRNKGTGTAFGITKYYRVMVIKCNDVATK